MASSLDSNAQAATQVLLGQLNYKLPATASYVLDRASSVFLTTGAGTFAPAGVRNLPHPHQQRRAVGGPEHADALLHHQEPLGRRRHRALPQDRRAVVTSAAHEHLRFGHGS